MDNDEKLQLIANELYSLGNVDEDIIICEYHGKVGQAFELNLFFKNDEDKLVFVEEHLRKEKFPHSYPHVHILSYQIIENKYGLNELYVEFKISVDDYVDHLYNVWKFHRFGFSTV